MPHENEITLARSYIKAGRYAEAVPLLKSAAEAFVTEEILWQELIYAATCCMQHENAVEFCKQAIRHHPRSEWLWCQMGSELMAIDRLDEAEQSLANACRLNPNDAQLWRYLARLHQKRKNLEKEIEALENLNALGEANSYDMNQLGIVYYNLGNYAKAVEFYRHSAALAPDVASLFNIGLSHSEVSQDADAAAPIRNSRQKYLLSTGSAIVVIIAAVFLLLMTQMNCRMDTRVYPTPIVDKIDYPFVNDPEVIGRWVSIDFVKKVDDFRPGDKHWRGDFYLKEMVFSENGGTKGPWIWTKGLIIHPGDKTSAKYLIREIDGSTYMFFECKSGDYTIRRMKPWYYVLKKVKSQSSQNEERQPESQTNTRQEAMQAEVEGKLLQELNNELEKWPKDSSPAAIKKCESLIDQIMAQPKPSAEAYSLSASAANLMGKPQKAIFLLKKAIAEYPDKPIYSVGILMPQMKVTGYYRIGAIARKIGDANEATKACEAIIRNTRGLWDEEFQKPECYMYLAEIASEILKDRHLAMKMFQEMIATIDTIDINKLPVPRDTFPAMLLLLREWASYELTRLKDGTVPVLQESESDKAKLRALCMLATGQMLINWSLLTEVEQVADNNSFSLDCFFARFALASSYTPPSSGFAEFALPSSYRHLANINPTKAEKYLLSIAETRSYFTPYANMMLELVREEMKRISERIHALLYDLKYDDEEKRERAADELARLWPDGIKALQQAQTDPNKYVRYEAACALGLWGQDESIKPDLNVILEAIKDEYKPHKALSALRGPHKPEIQPKQIATIVGLMNDHYSMELSYAISDLLSSASPEVSKAAVPELMKLLKHENPDVRCAVLDILRQMGPKASEALPSLIQLLPYEHETRKDYIFEIISGMGPAAEPFMPEIAKYLDHEDIHIQLVATSALKRISPEKAEQIFKAREKEKAAEKKS
jgi:tetratricopeptide (TPR) repeat protein